MRTGSASRSNMARSKRSSPRSRRRNPILNSRSSSGRTSAMINNQSEGTRNVTAIASTVRASGRYRRLQNERRADPDEPRDLVTKLVEELNTADASLEPHNRQGQPLSRSED